jgi:hypothetical protein
MDFQSITLTTLVTAPKQKTPHKAGQYLKLDPSLIHSPALAAKAKETERCIYLLVHGVRK